MSLVTFTHLKTVGVQIYYCLDICHTALVTFFSFFSLSTEFWFSFSLETDESGFFSPSFRLFRLLVILVAGLLLSQFASCT